MPMTPEDLANLEKLLRRRERRAKDWLLSRWIIASFGLLLIGISLWFFIQTPEAWRTLIPIADDCDFAIDALIVMPSSMAAVHFCILWSMAVLHGVPGVMFFSVAMCRWRRGNEERLLIKTARSWLETQAAQTPEEPAKPHPSSASPTSNSPPSPGLGM